MIDKDKQRYKCITIWFNDNEKELYDNFNDYAYSLKRSKSSIVKEWVVQKIEK